jgi:glycosyltransferase involved in cell wall biosynthesis
MIATDRRGHRLRVAHVTLGLDVGGQEKLLVEFARHADRGRFDLTFVCLGGRGKLAGAVEACGWPVVALDAPPGLRPGLVPRLAGLFRRRRIDLVHTHDDKPLLYAPLAARLARVPRVVHTRHHGHLPWLRRRHAAMTRLAARLTSQFVCVSDDSARLTAGDGVRARTIWNGIDMSRFSYTGPRADGPVVAVGRLSPEKDHPTLLRAVALAGRAAPLRWEVAGNGPCRAALERLAAELGLGDRVRFLGEVADVPALLGRASVFVLPSLTEGLSLTLLEATARGLPVVATRVGGNPEVVVDGETGLLVPPGAPAALAGAVLRLLDDPATARRLGAAGRRRVETHFDVRRMVAEYETLYHDHPAAPGAR